MPNTTTSLGTTAPAIPVIATSQRNKSVFGTYIFETKADLTAAITAQRANPIWFDKAEIINAFEPRGVYRSYHKNVNSADSHARNILINGRAYELPLDSSQVHETFGGAPGGITGSNGEYAYDAIEQVVYSKTNDTWSIEHKFDGSFKSKASESTTRNLVAADDKSVVNVTGTPDFTITTTTGPIMSVIKRLSEGQARLLSGSDVTFILDGAVVTTVTISAKGSAILVEPGSVANEYFITKKGT